MRAQKLATAFMTALVIHGTGRSRGQPATFLVATYPEGSALWSVRTADGRVEAAWSDDSGAEPRSWSNGVPVLRGMGKLVIDLPRRRIAVRRRD